MREVDLHGAPGDEHALADLRVCESLGHEVDHLKLGRGEALPAVGRPLTLAAGTADIGNRLVERERFALGAGDAERVVAERFAELLRERVHTLLLRVPTNETDVGPGAVGGTEQPCGFVVTVEADRDLGEGVEGVRDVEMIAALGLVCERLVRELLGGGEYELEWIEAAGGTRSPLETPLWDVIQAWVEAADPEAALAPLCLSGFTDSHWMREAFGTVAYGFFPMQTMSAELATLLVHSANERIPIADLELGVDFYRFAARALLS